MSDAVSSPVVTILLGGVGGAFACGDLQPVEFPEGLLRASRHR